MIKDLSYTVTFPTNGISLNGQYSFQPGTTAVSGRNGTGKSFISEMIRYGLFGVKALRGPASDYKQLDMRLVFRVGEHDYVVERGKKQQIVNHEGTQAVGADAVNKKVIEILGFGLEVFDVVCAANQKESERLTRLTPGKRKELIDDVVGLTAQEAVEKACRDEASGLRREAEALSRALVAPTEPVKPKGYRPSQKIGEELAATKALVERRAGLQRVIDAVGASPVEPARKRVDVESLEVHEAQRLAVETKRETLQGQSAAILPARHTREQLEAAAALLEYDAEVKRRGPRPDHSLEQLQEWRDIWSKKQIANHSSATCPKCSHRFALNIDKRDLDIVAIQALPEPPLKPADIGVQELRHGYWKDELVEPADGIRLSQAEIVAGAKALDRAEEKQRLITELDALPQLVDMSAELRAGREINQEWAIYERDHEAYLQRQTGAAIAEEELRDLKEPKHTIADLDAAFVAARVYESQLTAYAENKARFDALSAEIAEKQTRAEGFAAGAKGLVEARRTLKAFLAPSLSRVATALIQQMTVNAERPLYEIVVDEEMNITADSQDVGTFNGAHATMINLALRLALGQVLVSRVFPVFVGDEIDSDLDVNNSQAIADALSNLKEQLKQIVIISHKRLEGMDEEIVL